MSDKVSDDFVRHSIKQFSQPIRPGEEGLLVTDGAPDIVSAFQELLRRRKDGQSPEEFVLAMAARLHEVAPEVQGNFLQHLSAIREGLMRIRMIEVVNMKPGGWS